MTRRVPFRLAALTATGIVALYAAWLVAEIGGPRVTQAFDDLGLIAVPLLAAGACWLAARRDDTRARRGWTLLAAAALAWSLGEAVWALYELGLGREVPFPSPADVGYLGAIPLAIAAILSFPTAPARVTSKLRTLLDGLIMVGALLSVSWVLLLGPLYRAGSAGLLEQVIGLAYPAGDVVIIGIALLVGARAQGGGRVPLLLVASGLAALALADSGFAYLTLRDGYATGNLIDVGWVAGYLLIGLAAVWASGAPPASRTGRERLTRLGAMLPFLAVLLGATVAALQLVGHGALDPFLFWNVLVVMLLVGIRQVLTLLENLSLTRNLEEKVQARTAELERAVRQLEEARRLQDAFVAAASHELRTPVTAMIGSASMLLLPNMGLGEDARMLAEMSMRSARRMSRLVEDLLIASGLPEGIRFDASPFDLTAELKTALEIFSPAGKAVEARIPEGLVALGDPERVGVILEQLLSNADKFAPVGTVVEVEAAAGPDAVEVVVRDGGPGVPPALRELVFDRFYQADGSSTREHGGLGLGLFIARRLAEGMGGRLTIDDAPSGATFRLTLAAAPRGTSVVSSPTPTLAPAP